MSRPVVDGQRAERAAPMAPLTFLPVAVPQIAAPERIDVFEISMSMWLEEDGWQDTLKMDLTELKG